MNFFKFKKIKDIRKKVTSALRQRGFTLIETFIAITILMITVAGPLTLAQRSLSSAQYTRDKITAYYLAQDAVEYLHAIRDDNALQGSSDWLSGFNSCLGTVDNPKYCQLDSSNETGLTSCNGGGNGSNCPLLKYNSLTGFYGYGYGAHKNQAGYNDSDWTDTVFTRTITMTPAPYNRDEVEIKVTMSWNPKVFSGTQSFTVYEHLFRWQ